MPYRASPNATAAILGKPMASEYDSVAGLRAIAGQDFRRLCGYWATGVAVLTTRDHEHRSAALTMNAVTSLSLDPPLMLACVATTSDTLPALRQAGVFCINILATGQEAVSQRCAGKGSDKLARIPHRVGVTGVVVIEGAVVALECRVVDEMSGGDHRIFVGEVVAAHESPGTPLLYYRGNYVTPWRPDDQ